MQGVAVAFGAFKTQLVDLIGVLDTPAMKDIGTGLSFLTGELGSAKVEVDKFAQAFPTAARALADLGVAAAAAAGGWLSLKMFTGLTGGFGLSKSAVALDASAAELTAAATMLKGGSVADAMRREGASPGIPSLAGRTTIGALTAADLLANAPTTDQGVADQVNGFNDWFNGTSFGKWLNDQAGGQTPTWGAAPAAEIRRPSGIGSDAVTGHTAGARDPLSAAIDIDTSALTDALKQVDALGQSRPTVTVGVDMSAFESALARIRSGLASLGALSGTPGLSPSLDSTIRGNFSYGGVLGE